MLSRSGLAEVVDHGFHILKRPKRIGPKISSMCFLRSGFEHLHWRLVGMQYGAAEYLLL